MNEITGKVRLELELNVDPSVRDSGVRYFKEDVRILGVKTATVGKIAKQVFGDNLRDKTKAEVFSLCEELWQSGYMEEAFIACNWSHFLNKAYEREDFKIFEGWVEKHVTNWAACDTLCNHTVGDFLEMYPEYITELKRWAVSPNRWMKRAAAVSLIIPARHGKFLEDIFEISDILLLDKDDLVQKGYGWMLKAASQAHLQEVFDYVMRNKAVMPRTSLRYAIEKMPDELKKKAMEK
ncbi:MAG: DNA alkylation repair protein [Clostridiales bacterium]|nr:DNA alkylation repair protein [Clostridiales bacterium]